MGENKVTGPYTATVNGINTGITGCDNQECERNCLRKDSKLELRINFMGGKYGCGLFIPAVEVEAGEA